MECSADIIVWKEPNISEIDAPSHLIKKIRTAIFYNSQGKMDGADRGIITQYVVSTVVMTWMLLATFILLLPIEFNTTLFFVIAIFGSVISLTAFYFWGWRNYSQAWYHIDTENKLFTVIEKKKKGWQEIEVPFEQVDRVDWSGGENGYAIIHAAGLEIPTSRTKSNRFASVTEMWPLLASFDTFMKGWPITLECSTCKRKFGHHIGTAQCPFDEMILNDPSTKGRIDPEELHPDDTTRV